jgi:TRAP-type transport system periplasmic protein
MPQNLTTGDGTSFAMARHSPPQMRRGKWRAATRGWSEGANRDHHSSVSYGVRAFCCTKPVVEAHSDDQSHHPGNSVGRPSRAIAHPSSVRGPERGCPISRRRELTKTLFAGALLMVLIAVPEAAMLQAQTPARIRLATLAPKGSSYNQILMAMGEKWRQAPGGGASLTIFADGSMGGEADMVRRMRVGQIQAGMLTVVGLAEIDPSVSALQNLPMMFRSLDEVDYIRQKLAPSIEKKLLEKGFVVLFWGDGGWVRFFSKEPMIYPADLKRMKLFTWAGDAKQLDIMKAGGYQPIPLETNDILPSLQTGLINAVPSTPFYALAGQFYGPASHMLELNWAPLVGGAVVTRKAWESLSAEARDAMMKAATEAGEQIKAKSRAESNQAVETMRKRGLTVHAATPEVEAAWRKAAEEVYPKIRGAIVPAEMFDEVSRLLQEFRKGAAAKR